jgi:hypothetical protein
VHLIPSTCNNDPYKQKTELLQTLSAKAKVQNSEVNNVQNVITIQKAITNSSVGQHGPPTNAKVGQGAVEE